MKYWGQVTLILLLTSCSLSQSFEPFLVHAKKLGEKKVEVNLIFFYLMGDFLISNETMWD